ncbi:probable N-acetylglucosaminyl-phosphatidylinositol de-N-acetylase isoform X2 [Phalaenopsis equestris]|uniref:probable N-acetylglucosaminyl-phosphatidylinositol de-N-acetylase isoform X2 n=1 Tax=Phalaenopsis equestris TaxID=78828 RepID=UPI0009E20EB2|nr:probable N-acetylglucosaminyl-phosphatidylinositol de-N-acetylase isoform X2 [Phalaenopsis equestris]
MAEGKEMSCWWWLILMTNPCNAEGKGNIRKEELYRACATLKVPLQQIKIVDHPDLQDGFGKPWSHQLLATFVEEEIKKHCIDVLISFDNYGVSGHPNHRDVHNGICIFLHKNVEINIEAWELISTNIIRKYIGPVDIWISLLSSLSGQNGSICCMPNLHPLKCYQAMAEHYSQWLWFRKLFVVLSRYTYVNTLRRIIY